MHACVGIPIALSAVYLARTAPTQCVHCVQLSPAIGYALASMTRHDGHCPELDEDLQMHRLDAARPGHEAALQQFAR